MSRTAFDTAAVSDKARSGLPPKKVPDALLALGLMAVVIAIWEATIRLLHVPTCFQVRAP